MNREQNASSAEHLSALVLSTLAEEKASISGMLQCIAKRMNAFGSGLWEVSQDAKLQASPPGGFLITLATWWNTGDLFAMDDVPLANSPAAWVAVNQQSKIVGDIQRDGGAKRNHPFWKRHDVRGMLAVPLTYLDGSQGVLNVYRREGADAFTEEDQRELELMAQLVPGLFRAVREKIGLDLVSNVERVLRDAEGVASEAGQRPKRLNLTQVKKVLQKVCKMVSDSFDCVEASVFLEDPLALPGTRFKNLATTEPSCAKYAVYKIPEDEGRLTGWVLHHAKPLKIVDLANFDRDWESLRKEYPGLLKRAHGTHDVEVARKRLKSKIGDDLPPLSFMAVPVFGGIDWLGGTDLRGVLRCYMARTGPYYFSDREINLLGVVAAQVGQWWARWRTRGELEQENQAWNNMVEQLGVLNAFVHEEFQKAKPDEGAVFRRALRVVEEVIPGAVLNDIRMHDPAAKELYFAQFCPAASEELTRLKSNDADRRFPIVPYSKHAGVRVFLAGKPWCRHDARSSKIYHPIFPNVERMVIVPIGVKNERFGLLDLRWTTKPIPPHAVQAATLLGRQLGIYHQLANLVAGQKEAVTKAEAQKMEETQANEDFAHQLRTPITEAQMRLELALSGSRFESERRPLYVLRGLFRRTERVAMSMRLLSELSHGRLLTLKPQWLDSDVLRKKMIELADDAEIANLEKQITFSVERGGFRPHVINSIWADSSLLEQMISNLLDNAGKYSRRNTVVRILAGISSTGRHYLAVTNKGLRFREGETEKCKLRSWRSPDAKLIASEGRGIGLWLVNEIMESHGGQLQVIPSNHDSETEIRLSFPPESYIAKP
ncbi:MAG: GAF domain-containing protein [Verrucomicrobia bacterium]|nr:GAF domain-containing protein [Verrucomicrobiota bacterium]